MLNISKKFEKLLITTPSKDVEKVSRKQLDNMPETFKLALVQMLQATEAREPVLLVGPTSGSDW